MTGSFSVQTVPPRPDHLPLVISIQFSSSYHFSKRISPSSCYFIFNSLWQSRISLFCHKSHLQGTAPLLPPVLLFTELNASCSACKVDWFPFCSSYYCFVFGAWSHWLWMLCSWHRCPSSSLSNPSSVALHFAQMGPKNGTWQKKVITGEATVEKVKLPLVAFSGAQCSQRGIWQFLERIPSAEYCH